MADRTRRPPAAYLLGIDGPSVEVPGWVADWLEQQTDLPRRRIALRGVDPAVDDVLIALREVAMRYQSRVSSAPSADVGTIADRGGVVERESSRGMDAPLTVTAAAALIGITSRACRRAIAEKRLPATRSGAVWVVDSSDALKYAETARRRRTA